ncbi:MAG TPA: von Willebrand factor type A domain-containing protein [Polyangiaceae bacterium]|nr:von Willebrand factor type A domain-containing protein [Polyangiaceae bacterium]
MVPLGCSAADASYSEGTDGDGYTAPWPETNLDEEPGEAEEIEGFQPFVVVDHDPLSTFAADVDTASYEYFRSSVGVATLPESASVRSEEFLNYFDYEYPKPGPDDAEPFTISLDSAKSPLGRPTTLLRVGIQGAVHPKPRVNLVFLVDTSGSMGETLAYGQAMLRETVELLDAEDSLAIVTYAGDVDTPLPATSAANRDAIFAAIDRLSSGGSTNGEGGIQAAYAQAESAFIEDGANHIILFTDGDFNVGTSSDEGLVALIEQKRKTGITLTVVGTRAGYNDRMLQKVTTAGNGIHGYVGSAAEGVRYARTQMLQTLVHIAKDVKLQVEFNPEHVFAYRLIGYENRALADDDFRDDLVDAGEIGSGHRVTALYELALTEDDVPGDAGAPELASGAAFAGTREIPAAALVQVKIRYKAPNAVETDAALEVRQILTPEELSTELPDSDLAWAIAVAHYAEHLQKSPYASALDYDGLRTILSAQVGTDPLREEFLQLFDKARPLER